MNFELFTLSFLNPGREATIVAIKGGKGWRRRLMEMGVAEGMKVKVLQNSFRGPMVISVGKTRLVLGYGVACRILVKGTK